MNRLIVDETKGLSRIRLTPKASRTLDRWPWPDLMMGIPQPIKPTSAGLKPPAGVIVGRGQASDCLSVNPQSFVLCRPGTGRLAKPGDSHLLGARGRKWDFEAAGRGALAFVSIIIFI